MFQHEREERPAPDFETFASRLRAYDLDTFAELILAVDVSELGLLPSARFPIVIRHTTPRCEIAKKKTTFYFVRGSERIRLPLDVTKRVAEAKNIKAALYSGFAWARDRLIDAGVVSEEDTLMFTGSRREEVTNLLEELGAGSKASEDEPERGDLPSEIADVEIPDALHSLYEWDDFRMVEVPGELFARVPSPPNPFSKRVAYSWIPCGDEGVPLLHLEGDTGSSLLATSVLHERLGLLSYTEVAKEVREDDMFKTCYLIHEFRDIVAEGEDFEFLSSYYDHLYGEDEDYDDFEDVDTMEPFESFEDWELDGN